jgi:hypothetical protein
MVKDQFKKISPTNEIDTSGTYNIHIQDENKLSNIPQKIYRNKRKMAKTGQRVLRSFEN